ncbi:MAG: TetR/AcrR family transcriptional regulator [Lachnospira sp.]|nr:TetR/AcrR family transcriptional regulator [Lachnospira sp.]
MARAGLDRMKIVEGAVKLVNEGGLKSLNMKDLAISLNIKSPSLYKHIEGIEKLQNDIMLYGYKALEICITQKALGKSGDAAVRAMCEAYYEYSLSNPGVFEIMQYYNRYVSDENKEATQGIYKITSKIFEAYKLTNEQKMHLVRTFRAFLQGYMSICINNGFGSPHSIKESFDLSVDILINGIKEMEE